MISPLNAKLDRKWIEASQRIATLEQQNAELVAALKKIEAMDYGRAAINMYGRLAHEIATEALAKVKQP